VQGVVRFFASLCNPAKQSYFLYFSLEEEFQQIVIEKNQQIDCAGKVEPFVINYKHNFILFF
jgi:hypothetical protein